VTILIEQPSVDLKKYPGVCEQAAQECTTGDVHANALKLVHFLIYQGVMYFDEARYERLVSLYHFFSDNDVYHYLNMDPIRTKDLQEKWALFKILMDSATFNPEVKVRIMGDDVADRGAVDLLTLYVLKCLDAANVPTEIMLSNHGLEFLGCVDRVQLDEFLAETDHEGCQLSNMNGQIQSIVNFRKLLRANVITQAEAKAFVALYRKHLNLVGFNVYPSHKSITLFMHAPSGLKAIRALAYCFDVVYDDKTLGDLVNTLKAINLGFKKRLLTGELQNDYRNRKLLRSPGPMHERHPIYEVTWNRAIDDALELVNHQNDYYLEYVCGHLGPSHFDKTRFGHLTNLDDTFLGKGPDMYEGKYLALVYEQGLNRESSVQV